MASISDSDSSHLFQRVASFLPVEFVLDVPTWSEGSHLFQRVASFLRGISMDRQDLLNTIVLISFREWLHSYRSMINKAASKVAEVFSSLSESGFIPTLFAQ